MVGWVGVVPVLQAEACNTGTTQLHPSSGVHKTVTTASGTGHAVLCSYLPPAWPSLATLEGGSCTKNMTSTGDCNYSFVYS